MASEGLQSRSERTAKSGVLHCNEWLDLADLGLWGGFGRPPAIECPRSTLSRHSQAGEVCLPRTLKRPLPATPGPSLASQPPPRGCHRVGATPGSLVRLIHRTPHVQDRRLRYRATRQGRYRGNGRNTLKIALKCGISADSEAEFRPTPRRSAG